MRFLFVKTEASITDLAYALRRMGHDVHFLDRQALHPLATEPQPFCEEIKRLLLQSPADYVITYLYIPQLSDVCNALHIPYISWNYDSPLVSLFHTSIYNDCNRIFLFDRAQYDRLAALKVPHIYHLPLAADGVRALELPVSAADREKYACDISFVGTLYEDNLYNRCRGMLPLEHLLPINQYLMQKLCQWEQPRPWMSLPDETVHLLTDILGYHSDICDVFEFPIAMYLGNLMLSRKLAEMERITALNTLTEVAPVDLYTASRSDQISALRLHAPIDYATELGKVYQCSKINLNFTLPSIESGIPQRVFDVLAYGGFLMTNAQPELSSCFTAGEDLVVFHNLAELKELAAYYLAHDGERARIASYGKRTVLENFTYEHLMDRVLSLCEHDREE